MSAPSVLLYWSIDKQKWTGTKDFQPGSNSGTFGSQWFSIPDGCVFNGGDSFSRITAIEGASISGQYSGSLRAGKYTVEPGSIKIEGASIHANNPCTLETDPVSNYPYLVCNGLNYPMFPLYRYRGARAGNDKLS